MTSREIIELSIEELAKIRVDNLYEAGEVIQKEWDDEVLRFLLRKKDE
jgi:hypothetical protein